MLFLPDSGSSVYKCFGNFHIGSRLFSPTELSKQTKFKADIQTRPLLHMQTSVMALISHTILFNIQTGFNSFCQDQLDFCWHILYQVPVCFTVFLGLHVLNQEYRLCMNELMNCWYLIRGLNGDVQQATFVSVASGLMCRLLKWWSRNVFVGTS